MVPKGLLTFLGSLYKEVAKTTSGTLVYRFERQTARKLFLPSKNTVFDLECRILSQEHDTIGKQNKTKIHGVTGCHENTRKLSYDFRSSMN